MVARRRPPVRIKPKAKKHVGLCGECVNCTPIYLHHTLTVHGRKPTMGNCPNMPNRRVLLSERGCEKWSVETE